MKNLIWWGTTIAAAATAVSVYADDVNFAKVNPVMQTLVDSVIAADENVDYAYPRFDENYCDLGAEKLKYDMTAAIKNTPWLANGRADVLGTSTYAVDHSSGHSGVTVTLSASANTDVFALIRYSAATALKKRQHSNPKYDQQIDAHLYRLAVAQTFDEVYDLLSSGNHLALQINADEVARAQSNLDCLQAGTCGDPTQPDTQQIMIQSAKDNLAAWQRMQANISALELKRFKDTSGVDTLTASSASINQLLMATNYPLQVGKTVVKFTQNVIGFDNESFYALSPSALAQLKADFQAKLVGLQSDDQPSKDYVQARFREALVEFKRTIRGDIVH